MAARTAWAKGCTQALAGAMKKKMQTPPNDRILVFAARLNALRIIPRGLVLAYYVFFAKFSYYLAEWFMAYDFNAIDNGTVALAIAGFPATILGVMAGVLASLTNNYFHTGGNGQ